MEAYFDIGGTHFRYSLIKDTQEVENGDIKSSETALFPFIESLLTKHKSIVRIGISFAGQVHNGTIISAPNIDIKESDIEWYFSSKYGIELKIENDLKCAALAESNYFGNSSMLVALYAGTGLGSAIVQHGKLISGKNNLAGEIGHIPFRDSPLSCGCGKNDCVEIYASGSGLAKWARHYNLNLQNVTLDALKELNTKESLEIVNGFHNALIHAASTAVTLLNPEIVVLGGGIIEANPYLVELIKEGVLKKAMKKQANEVKIYKSSIRDAGILGAKLLFSNVSDYNIQKETHELFSDKIEDFVSKEVASHMKPKGACVQTGV